MESLPFSDRILQCGRSASILTHLRDQSQANYAERTNVAGEECFRMTETLTSIGAF
jgi:hypothetical protein